MDASADRRLVAGRYVVGGPLGRGGMGTVWWAEDVLLGWPVAVKEVEPANVMVTADSRVKLADFGTASLQDDTQRTLTGAARSLAAVGPARR